MSDKTSTAKDGPTRLKEFRDRQRAAGRHAFQIWVTPDEQAQIKAFLLALRKRHDET